MSMATPAQTWNRPLADLLNPWRIGQSLYAHRTLIHQFVKRDVLSRYRGSFLGLFLALVRPLAMLAVYSFVFVIVIPNQMGQPGGGKVDTVLALFCGLVLFDLVGECFMRAPMLVRAKPGYVTKVVFPLEILAISALGAALVQLLISFGVFFAVLVWVKGAIPLTALFLPLAVLPLTLFVLGLTWIGASIGVYVRDINAFVPVVLTVVLFGSAIFYSIEQVPPDFRWLMQINPIAMMVHEARNVTLLGVVPDWITTAANLAAGIVIAVLGYAFFMRSKRGFADVM
jgi:lipopolysaccharide transport system permease protein